MLYRCAACASRFEEDHYVNNTAGNQIKCRPSILCFFFFLWIIAYATACLSVLKINHVRSYIFLYIGPRCISVCFGDVCGITLLYHLNDDSNVVSYTQGLKWDEFEGRTVLWKHISSVLCSPRLSDNNVVYLTVFRAQLRFLHNTFCLYFFCDTIETCRFAHSFVKHFQLRDFITHSEE